MPHITTKDGIHINYKDWGNPHAQTVVFSHGWPLSSDAWESQMLFLVNQGYRTIAHDRRGHGRSSQPWDGNDMDTFADDLNELLETLDIQNAMLVGHSTGGGEVVRFLSRHGWNRVAKAVLISAVPPLLVKTDASPNGVPLEVFDSFREAMSKDRAQFFFDIPNGPFFGFNRPDAKSQTGDIWLWWQQGMMCGFKNAYDCIKAFSETDFRDDLRKIDIPVLVLHGDDDQVVPIDASGRETVRLLKKGTLEEVAGGPHGLPTVCSVEVNDCLLKFLRSTST